MISPDIRPSAMHQRAELELRDHWVFVRRPVRRTVDGGWPWRELRVPKARLSTEQFDALRRAMRFGLNSPPLPRLSRAERLFIRYGVTG